MECQLNHVDAPGAMSTPIENPGCSSPGLDVGKWTLCSRYSLQETAALDDLIFPAWQQDAIVREGQLSSQLAFCTCAAACCQVSATDQSRCTGLSELHQRELFYR
jgi:hypothetical protein